MIRTLLVLVASAGCSRADPQRDDPARAGAASLAAAAADGNGVSDTTHVEFEIGLPPGEGIPVIGTVASELRLYACPRSDCAVRYTLATEPGRQLSYDSTRYQTLEPASVITLARTEINGRDMGPGAYVSRDEYYAGGSPRISLEVDPGDAFQLLQHRAEGTCFVRIRERVLDAESCPAHDASRFEVSGEPLTHWWIHVNGADGRSGWLLLDDSTARVVGRRF